jgi:hypothetical protein
VEHDKSALTRRAVIGGFSLGVAGAGIAATTGVARPAGASATGDPNRGPARGAAGELERRAAAATPGTTYRSVAYGAFHTYGGTAVIMSTGSGVWSSDTLLADIDLPHAAQVTELAVWGGAGLSLELLRADAGIYVWTTIGQVSAPSGAGIVTATTTLPAAVTVDNAQHAYLLAVYMSSATAFLTSARVGYRAAGPFHAISPTRVYDSRPAGTAITTGTTRTVSVVSAGAGTADVVPAGASAITFNLTITATTGRGYLTLVPLGGTSAASTLNWYAKDQTIANGGTVALGGDRQLTLVAGGVGSTHAAIDITGYFL